MFDLDSFIDQCRTALAQDAGGHRAVREVAARAVADPGAVLAGLGAPERGGITALHRSADLTILNVVWGPRMTIMPHNHRMWAVIGAACRMAGSRPPGRNPSASGTARCWGRTSSIPSPTRCRG
jgi:hypothetical protein